MSKILIAILSVLMLTTLGSAFMARNAITGQMEENGVFYDNGNEMHVVAPDNFRTVNNTVGTPVNASFDPFKVAQTRLGFPGKNVSMNVTGDTP